MFSPCGWTETLFVWRKILSDDVPIRDWFDYPEELCGRHGDQVWVMSCRSRVGGLAGELANSSQVSREISYGQAGELWRAAVTDRGTDACSSFSGCHRPKPAQAPVPSEASPPLPPRSLPHPLPGLAPPQACPTPHLLPEKTKAHRRPESGLTTSPESVSG